MEEAYSDGSDCDFHWASVNVGWIKQHIMSTSVSHSDVFWPLCSSLLLHIFFPPSSPSRHLFIITVSTFLPHALTQAAFHPFFALSLCLCRSPLQILIPSLRAVSLLRAQRARRVLYVSLPREQSTGRPPPLHHGEGGVRELGPNPQHQLSPARLEAHGCHLWIKQLTHVIPAWTVRFRLEAWVCSPADKPGQQSNTAAAVDLLYYQLGRDRSATQKPDQSPCFGSVTTIEWIL